MRKICVAIDGPASSGKSTVAKLLAKDFHLVYLDTGAMYRCMTYYCLEAGIPLEDEEAVASACAKQSIRFEKAEDKQLVFLNEVDVTEAIRSAQVTENVSLVSSYKKVREDLVKRQQAYIHEGGIIMDGRDIGTVVMPQAEVKIFLVASAKERARRRYEENQARRIPTASLDELQKQIEHRDYLDSTRTNSPLTKAADAIELDTTPLSIPQVVAAIAEIIQEAQDQHI